MKKTRHKRCWYCGGRLSANKGIVIEVNGNDVEAHKHCRREALKAEARRDNAFGMEY